MQDRHLCWPLAFSLAPQWPPHFFNSRLATGRLGRKACNRYIIGTVFEKGEMSNSNQFKSIVLCVLANKPDASQRCCFPV